MAKPERQIPKERPRLKAGVARPHTALRRILRQMPKGVRDVLDVLEAKGAPGFLVGGAVWDAFLGPHHQADWDLASRAPPKDVASWFK
ncbi:hypothetical protein KAI87_16385, partial [Myxococcota bacterium]|nr:hypothetical protein [Myxococcota bacterium]